MKMKQKMGIVLISIILLSATALAATPVVKPEAKLKAAFTVTYYPKMPLTVKVTDKSTGSPTKWAWNFGDKTAIVKTKNAIHTYKKAGTYTVTLTVMKGTGKNIKTSKATMKITVPKKKM